MPRAVITIGRQFGSGGREVGHMLAKMLGVPVYDREIVTLAAEGAKVSEEALQEAEEKAPGRWGFSMFAAYETPMSDKIFLAQSAVIRRLAGRPCVIVGRCADWVLKDRPDRVSVFIHADLPYRIERVRKRMPETEPGKIKELITGVDQSREKYYNYYTRQKWGEIGLFHLSVNSAKIGLANCARLIGEFVDMRL